MDVHQPAGGLGPGDLPQSLGDARGEERVPVGDIHDQGLQARDPPRGRVDPRDLEEGMAGVPQVETIPVALEVVGGVASQTGRILPVVLPDVQVLRSVHGAVANGQQQARDGHVLTGDLTVDPGDLLSLAEQGEQGDLIGGSVDPGDSDPVLVEKVEASCHVDGTSLSPVEGEYSRILPASCAR